MNDSLPEIGTLEGFYLETGKVLDKHKIRTHDRMWIVSVGMITCFNPECSTGKPDVILEEMKRFLKSHFDEHSQEEASFSSLDTERKISSLLRKSSCLTQPMMSELMSVLLRTALNLGDYTGGWFNEAGGFEADGYYPTPPDVVHLIRNLILTNFPDRRIPAGTRIYDPTCGTGSMLLPFMEPGVQVYGQEKDEETFLGVLANTRWKGMDNFLRSQRRQETKATEQAFQSIMDVVRAF